MVACARDDGRRDPFWKGTDVVQVCKKPYYSSNDCYQLNVFIADDKSYAQIYFPNGGYLITEDIECYKAANLDNSPEYVFCRSWDDESNQWDFLPRWVNY